MLFQSFHRGTVRNAQSRALFSSARGVGLSPAGATDEGYGDGRRTSKWGRAIFMRLYRVSIVLKIEVRTKGKLGGQVMTRRLFLKLNFNVVSFEIKQFFIIMVSSYDF
ncbi:hypothetical protein GWI33_006025 [Rhynchophorus ferrugineus]|uniref:Uncharacterized protein n=1 Tax=Rhynchophorus ferrugineus TaxID=354439 RepID=A0A834MPM8_RHYFE|nr:hypothetical protein GWI33_006025 [Rhynchophorus ferrugineus]